MGQQPRKQADGGLFYPPLEEDIQEAGLETIETYIHRIQNTIDQYIATGTILELCKEAEWCLGEQVPKRESARAEEALVKEKAEAGQDVGEDKRRDR